jgi:hypothetical protein
MVTALDGIFNFGRTGALSVLRSLLFSHLLEISRSVASKHQFNDPAYSEEYFLELSEIFSEHKITPNSVQEIIEQAESISASLADWQLFTEEQERKDKAQIEKIISMIGLIDSRSYAELLLLLKSEAEQVRADVTSILPMIPDQLEEPLAWKSLHGASERIIALAELYEVFVHVLDSSMHLNDLEDLNPSDLL